MPPLFRRDGKTPLELRDGGGQLMEGALIVDDLFGEGKAVGTVPIAGAEGVNIVIEWIGTSNVERPPSRGLEHLAKAPGGRADRLRHSGAAFERGDLHRGLNHEEREAAEHREREPTPVPEDGIPETPADRGLGGGAAGAAATATRWGAAIGAGQQDQHQPWLGKADKLDATGKAIIAEYEHRIVAEQQIHEGVMVEVPKIKYRTKHEAQSKERLMGAGGFNPSRLGDYLLKSPDTPEDVKERVARKMRSAHAKEFVAELDKKNKIGEQMHESLSSTRKEQKISGAAAGGAEARHNDRERKITDFVARDAAMPAELSSMIMYLIGVFIYMCRLPFSFVSNVHFTRFLWAIRPNFAKLYTPRTLSEKIAQDILDEVYEEAKEIRLTALAKVPGRPTLGMDGHKEGKHRHVETVTTAKLGISTFAGMEYTRTTSSTGKALADIARRYMDETYIALVADNTGNNTGPHTGLFTVIRETYLTLFCLGCFVHVFDLLIEDLAKLPHVKKVGDDAHFCVSFIRKHGLLFEEFLICQQRLGVKLQLVVFPATRFAYLFLMIHRVLANLSALRLVSESPTYLIVKASTKKRGEEGKKALAEFQRFEELVFS